MAPNGNDANPGTFALPVKSFNAAVQKLPFGTAGINGGHAYGVIKMKPGYYATSTGFQQSTSAWKNGNTYKNISLEGIGEVIIGGTKDSFATGHLLLLRGDHIYIKNIKLKYSTGIGLLLNRTDVKRQSNVLIDNVVVDSVGGFSFLLTNIDSILVLNSKSLYSSRPGNDSLISPCQWPSGLKVFGCNDATVHHCEVAYSRGEGLNFQNSLRGLAYKNKLHDNGLNFYNDNSAKLIVHSNHIYNTPGIGYQYWRNCPADTSKTWSGSGFLIANEGSCMTGSLPSFQGCKTVCKFPDENFSNVDSMFIYNNILQNVGNAFGFWEGRTDINGVNCIRNVFIFNNTIIGVMGMPGAPNGSLISAYFPDYNVIFNSYYGYLQNVKITNNIFTYDTLLYPNMKPVSLTFHALHPGPKDIKFDNNLWIQKHSNFGPYDLVRNNMPGSTYLLSDSLNSIQPCPQNQYWNYNGIKPFDFLDSDYLFRNRLSPSTNVGALEYRTSCNSGVAGFVKNENLNPKLYPNPCINCKEIRIENLSNNNEFIYSLFTIDGKMVESGKVKNSSLLFSQTYNGVYILLLNNQSAYYRNKLVLITE